jgi:glycosyltransferase involved in cell wall biosynthesis
MKILVLNYEFPPIGGGGGQAAADLCRALANRGHLIRVITSLGPGVEKFETQQGYRIQRVNVGRRTAARASFLSMLRYLLAGFIPAYRQIRSWAPDVIHVHFAVPTGVLAWVLHRLTGTPYLLTVHLGDVPGGVPQKTGKWFRWVLPFTPPIWRRAGRVVAVSEYTRHLATTHYDVPIDVIPNGVPLKQGLRVQVQSPPQFLFAGRFQPQKNLHFLVDALGEVRDLEWRCVLVGDGPQRQSVQNRVRENGLESRINFTGWISPQEVDDLMARSDILVMPSLSEGLPVVGVQALANGLALVVNQAGGLSELVNDGINGRSCLVGDESCFIQALRWCLSDRERLMKMKSSSLEEAKAFDIERITDLYESKLHEVTEV